jgi:hypothetical protein
MIRATARIERLNYQVPADQGERSGVVEVH